MLQQEEHRCGDHRMACQTLRVQRPIRADFPWTFLSTNPSFNARVFFSIEMTPSNSMAGEGAFNHTADIASL